MSYRFGEEIHVSKSNFGGVLKRIFLREGEEGGVFCLRGTQADLLGGMPVEEMYWPQHKAIELDKPNNIINLNVIEPELLEDIDFIGTWVYEDRPCCEMYRIYDGCLEEFSNDSDTWVTANPPTQKINLFYTKVGEVIVPLDLSTKFKSLDNLLEIEDYKEAVKLLKYLLDTGHVKFDEAMEAIETDHGHLTLGNVYAELIRWYNIKLEEK